MTRGLASLDERVALPLEDELDAVDVADATVSSSVVAADGDSVVETVPTTSEDEPLAVVKSVLVPEAAVEFEVVAVVVAEDEAVDAAALDDAQPALSAELVGVSVLTPGWLTPVVIKSAVLVVVHVQHGSPSSSPLV